MCWIIFIFLGEGNGLLSNTLFSHSCSFFLALSLLFLIVRFFPRHPSEALRYCRENHVDLVSVHTEGIQRWVETVARNASTDNVWVGLRHTCAQGWIWSDGSNSSYRGWNTGEPNSDWEDTCVQFDSKDEYRWSDVRCVWTDPFVCYEGE
uniref:C-type lectin domain-containing protein n=1 Tax=Astyanax mexicanus TaxID=7994 RepID=A0A3B1KIV5_ASTMX